MIVALATTAYLAIAAWFTWRLVRDEPRWVFGLVLLFGLWWPVVLVMDLLERER